MNERTAVKFWRSVVVAFKLATGGAEVVLGITILRSPRRGSIGW